MNWLDVVIVCLIGIISVAELVRGFGRAFFDLLCLLAAAVVASLIATCISTYLPFTEDPAVTHASVFIILFCAFGWGSLKLSRFLYGTTLLNMGMFENLLGLLVGFVIGVFIAHNLVSVIASTTRSDEGGAALVTNGAIADEVLTFHSYHTVIEAVHGGSLNHDVADGATP